MKNLVAAATVLAALAIGCDTSETTSDRPCGGGTCGYFDHHYNSTFYCPPAPFVPGGWYGYTWHDEADCHEECATASGWGCSTGGCDTGCDQDVGSGAWVPCDAANGGAVTTSGCYLDGSGVTGETVACVCR
jgi:hypothetical protein